ncbi:ABC transporter permease [Nitratireductor sp. GISD-1A_MAKvit]|uniref:ABC transporter permease n=1 Tax=Nitratireductor sp. GISD-1A_MAKvit TaxID=3234198 RepID=UPI0034661975
MTGADITSNTRKPGLWQECIAPLALELWRDKTGLVSFVVLTAIIAMAVFAPLIAPHDPAAQSIAHRLTPPVWLERGVWAHPLGTDHLGRDVLSRIIWGARLTLLIGACVVLFGGALGTTVGLWAGYRGGRTDNILMRIVDIQVSFPGILLILLIVSVMGASVLTIIVVLSLTNWMVFARFVRGTVASLRQSAYVEAAEIVGCHPARILFRHILPNLITPLLVLSILEFTNIVLAEAAISFLGLGIQPPATSWGLDIASGRDYIFIAWWLVTFPGLCIVGLVLSLNMFSNWVRVTTDPQEREKRFARSQAARRGGLQ